MESQSIAIRSSGVPGGVGSDICSLGGELSLSDDGWLWVWEEGEKRSSVTTSRNVRSVRKEEVVAGRVDRRVMNEYVYLRITTDYQHPPERLTPHHLEGDSVEVITHTVDQLVDDEEQEECR